MPSLFEPWSIGRGLIPLQHRIVLAPLTRIRADLITRDPNALIGEYYAQRASAGGLIITEATYISERAGGMPGTPGLYTEAQAREWKAITDAVHAKGGKIFVQLWASGRTSTGQLGQKVVSASNIPLEGEDKPVPEALTEEEIKEYVQDHVRSAELAIEAGFDGVELHGAHGYLIDQFFSSASNIRTDGYGGPLASRARFALEILTAVSSAIGAARVGIRLSPFARAQGVYTDASPAEHIEIARLIKDAVPELGYVHYVEPRADPAKLKGWDVYAAEHDEAETLEPYRQVFEGSGIEFLSAGGYSADSARETAERYGGGIVFGRWFISNPDLPERIKNDLPLEPYDRPTFYSRGPQGYTTYSAYSQPPTQPPSPPSGATAA